MFYFTYFFVVLLHKWYVLVAGLRVGGIPFHRLLIHDWTKFTKEEFGQYARKYYGGYYPKSLLEAPLGYTGRLNFEVKQEYLAAWRHHYTKNDHHWQYWIGYDEPQEMSEIAIREMLADWFAASRSYTGSWLLTDWLQVNLPKINIHTNTRIELYQLLREFGYEIYDEPGKGLLVRK